MDVDEVPAAALLMTQFRRLAGLLILNGVPAVDLEHEVRQVADRANEARQPRLRVVPAG